MRGNLPIGSILTGYRIESVLSAAGNFAAVYLAYDTDAGRVTRRRERVNGRLERWRGRYGAAAARTVLDPGPYVALKEYAPNGLSMRQGKDILPAPGKERVFDWGRDRFVRESKFLSEHSHPNVVAVYDRFSANRTEYYVMERLVGGSLEDWLQQHGPQDEAQMRGWLMPILEGLASVERRDANHLDISPGNIMFRQVGGDPVLVDFGAARIPGIAQVHSTRLIVDEHFAAPEKFDTGSRQLDSRCDIYSLAAVANFALSGERPPTSNARLSGRSDMSMAAMRRRAEKASPDVLRVIDRAFSQRRDDRYGDATAFAEALRNDRSFFRQWDAAGGAAAGEGGSGGTAPIITLLVAAAVIVIIIVAMVIGSSLRS